MDIANLRNVYFIGIGGIGMSAIARYFRERGVSVSGYDRHSSSLTRELESEGISIHYLDDPSLADREAELIIYTPAIAADHRELSFFREKGYPIRKRSEVLQEITRDLFSITVAGTHGKTTISTLIAHILRSSGYGCNAFLGGISVNYHTNYWSSSNPVAVVEADEYDRSFLRLTPDIAVLTAMDPDHLDIYGTPEVMEEAFIEYTARVRRDGWLISKKGLRREKDWKADQTLSYSLEDQSADIYGKDISLTPEGYRFNVVEGPWDLGGVTLQLGGLHNVENTVAAVGVAHRLGIGADEIRAAVAGFKGVKRRFEFILREPGRVYIDDYAHHPEELKALIRGARQLFPGMACTVIFQPHLFSRTRDLAPGFAHSLELADRIILLPVYPAREEPIEGVHSGLIASLTHTGMVELMDQETCLEWLRTNPVQLLITCGAGDIDQLVDPIRTLLQNQKQ